MATAPVRPIVDPTRQEIATEKGDTNPYDIHPDKRDKVFVGGLSDKIAAAQARLRDASRVSVKLESGELDQNMALWSKDPAKEIVHGCGWSNEHASLVFARRFLALEETVAAQSELIVLLNAAVEELKSKRKKV